jgi:hypothetical protein
MTLLFNVYITQIPGNRFTMFDRGNLAPATKLNVAKYSLASLAEAYPWTNAIINVELDASHSQSDKVLLGEYVASLFKHTKLSYSTRRYSYQSEWQSIYKELDDYVFYLGNHDHIFIDSTPEYLKALVGYAKQLPSDLYPTIAMSHWPEAVRWAKSGYIGLHENQPQRLNPSYKLEKDYATYQDSCIDSLNIIPKSLYFQWFFSNEWGGVGLPRTDGIGGATLLSIFNTTNTTLPKQTVIVPYKEQLRHFDGYMHQRINNETCPAIAIPDGFFLNQIKVRYGYDNYKPGWVNLNPINTHYYAANVNGVDDKITITDIPHFWINRISDIDINPSIDEEAAIQHRLQSILHMLYSDDRYNPYIDEEMQTKVLNKYVSYYSGYSLL